VSGVAGFATFLMTDVEGSTRLWEQQREAMAASLAAHDELLHAAVSERGGVVVKSTGDGILASFERAVDALAAAVDIQRRVGRQRWATSEPLRIRVAIHTGEAQARGGDYFGPALNRTARLLAIGHGGQILVSAAAAELSRDELPAGTELVDQGEHRLRDLDRPERVFQLAAPELGRSFPPLRSERIHRTNLPAQLTSFVGRQRELAELRQLASDHRLVTLVGVGGTGKTRLMLELAGDLRDRFADGVWLAELAAISDPQLVVVQVARAVGVNDEPGRATVETVIDFLRDKKLLLLIDNCEHVIAAVSALVERVTATGPGVVIFSSSREALGIAGEVAYPVPSLDLPDGTESSLQRLASSEAVRLFVDRASAAMPSFELNEANGPTVVDICRRLDGIPLAIELAAARVNVLSVDEIDARLGDRFRLLTGGRRSVLPRQQTLQALIDWSWNLLSESDRRLLRRLAVFSGGWTLEAAATVTAGVDGAEIDTMTTLDGLSRLVDRSLVQVDRSETTRFRLLETIRQYARDRLLDSREADESRAAHLDYFLHLALAAEKPLYGPEMITWLHRLDAEVDNLRAALDWAMEADVDRGVRMLLALGAYYRVRSFGSEPVDRFSHAADVALARPREVTGPGRETTIVTARIAAAAAQANAAWGSPQAAVRYGAQALELARALDDQRAILEALTSSGMSAVFAGAAPEALRLSDEVLRLARDEDDPWILSMVLVGQALTFASLGDPESAQRRLVEATAAAERSGNPFVIGFAALNRGRLAGFAGDTSTARAAFAEASDIYRDMGDRRYELIARSDLGHAVRNSGDLDEAEEIYRETIREWQRLGNRGALANQLECFAFISLGRGDNLRAARLFGAAEAIRTEVGAAMMPYERIVYEPAVASLRAAVAAEALDQAWREGGQMSVSEAVDLAAGG
jgi:predicted ATPase/class 3 adenylate cyclase